MNHVHTHLLVDNVYWKVGAALDLLFPLEEVLAAFHVLQQSHYTHCQGLKFLPSGLSLSYVSVRKTFIMCLRTTFLSDAISTTTLALLRSF